MDDIFKSFTSMLNLNEDYLVKYIDCTRENENRLKLKMENFTENLKNILEIRSEVFTENDFNDDEMNSIKHFIMSHIFKDLITCVNYFHNREVPITFKFVLLLIIFGIILINCFILKLINRNLQPNNIFIDTNANRISIKLSDYGLADVFHRLNIDSSSVKYIAPEVSQQTNQNITTKADIYSLGVIAKEMFDLEQYV